MKTSFHRQTTSDNLILQGLLYEPEQKTNKLILHIHGMAGNFYENRFLDYMAKTFTKNGYAFLAVNTRGHDYIADFPIAGDKEDDIRIGNVFEKFEECVLDIKCWMDFAAKKFSQITLQGHSLGCSKVVYYLSETKDKRVKNLSLASPTDMVGMIERWSGSKQTAELSKKRVSEGKGEEIFPKVLGDWAYLSASTYLNFVTRGNSIDIFNTYAKHTRSIALESIKIPTLAFFGTGDDICITKTPKEALEIIKSKAKNCPKFDIEVIKDAPHSYFNHEQEVTDLILNWLKNTNS
ncbi:alpha/beta fold hydrolase [Candidatus Daviesbacteria bacterium]|nr:alpha/beta fold hydrolase [Candidatus Daviesbacteria bacterium]